MSDKKFKFSFVINSDLCAGCAQCYSECKFNAVGPDPDTLASYKVDQDACKRCSKCYVGCPVDGCIDKVAS